MALPRPAFLGLAGLALILAAFLAVHGIGRGSGSGSQTPVQTTPKHVTSTAAPAKTATTPAPATHAASGTAAKPATPVKVKPPVTGAAAGLPLPVAQAFAKHQIVVIYFGARGADDAATAASVKELKASVGSGVAVFVDRLTNLADYRRVVAGLDVSQAPSIVIVDRARKGTLLEGYIDAGSLRQAVADVAR
jgi:hypothetical protein